jgi:hypothetical protein
MVQQLVDTRSLSNVETGFPCGFDGGNTDTCLSLFANGVEKTVVIPSTVTEIVNNKLATLREAVAPSVEGEVQSFDQYKADIIIEYSGRTYLVGYSAMRQTKRANTQKGDDTRYYSVEQVVRMLAASALAVPYSHYELSLVTTVPFGYYTKSLRQNIKQTLAGIHDFKINGIERHAIVRVKQVLVEGSPALVLYGAASANTRRLVIDGGGHTTEFLTFDGRDPIAALCHGVELGVETIGDYVADQLLEKHNRRITALERSDILRAYGSRNSPQATQYSEISCGSYVVSAPELHALCHVGATQLAEATINEASMIWGKVNNVVAGDIAHQYHMGGVVHFCNDIMRESKMPNLRAVTDSEKANARGCARLAKALS